MATDRRLAAVMITDIVGFATKAQRSEVGALQQLEEHRAIVRAVLREHHGREVKTLGDGFLVEFASALSATECGIEILRRLDERNRKASGERIDLRIGIHLGDVVPEGNDILGDAVNIASRLEPLAEPGGLLISGPVYDQVRGRISLGLQPLPTPSLKHILVPISVYRVELPWKAPPVPATTPWVGRERESAALAAAQDRARQGEGSTVVLLGEPGVGKSRLVEQFLKDEEASGGVQVLRGQALRGEEGVPYAVWAEAVRTYARRARPEPLARACGPHLAEVARLVPEVAQRLGRAADLPPTEPELAEDRLMDGLVQFFANLAHESPLVVFLDDLQWSDPYSQRLLRRAARALSGQRVLLVVAARDHDVSEAAGAAELWAELRRQPGCSVTVLGRLPPAEFDRFLDALLPPPGLSSELRRRFHERCDGNPWFAAELLRRQVEAGALRPSKAGWTMDASEQLRIPESIHLLLRDRLSGVDPATLQVLRAASVAGGRIPYDLLRSVSGTPEDLFVICVERALTAQILEERLTPSGEVELAFHDTLTRDVLYDSLSLVRARVYHRKLAEGLEQLPEPDRRSRAPQLAEHFLRGAIPDKALTYTLLAAGRAVELHAHPEAEHLYRTALDLMDEVAVPDTQRAETVRALAKELELLGRTSAAVERYQASADLWEKAGQRRQASSVHSWMAMLLNDLPGREAEVARHSEAAMALLRQESESAELAQAYYSLGAEALRWGSSRDRAEELFRHSVELAAKFGDMRTEAFGTYFLAVVLPFARKTEAMELAGRLTAKLESADDPTLPGILYNVGANLWLAGKGDVPSARALLERARDVATRKGIRRYDTAIALGLADLGRFEGSWPAAETVARGVLAEEPEENILERVEASLLLARLATARGRLEEAERLLTELGGSRFRTLLASQEAALTWALVRAEYSFEAGDPDGAWSTLEPALEETARLGVSFTNALVWCTALHLAVATAAARKDPASARPWLDRLRSAANDLDEPWARAFQGRAEGLEREAGGAWPEAVRAYGESLEWWRRVAWPFEVGKTLYLLGRAQNQAESRGAGTAALEEGAEIFSRIGADRYAERSLVEQRTR